jgi:glycosyltransferase involved in cell wall biosynthesis
MTKISVVVSIRDCGERIIEALESISAQTYPSDNVETIVVDYGSTDMSPALARRFLARHGMRGSVLPIDGDIWAAFDAGWHQVDGQWVQFLKGQDLLAPTHLEVLAKAISEADETVQALAPVGNAFMQTEMQARYVQQGLVAEVFCSSFRRTLGRWVPHSTAKAQ